MPEGPSRGGGAKGTGRFEAPPTLRFPKVTSTLPPAVEDLDDQRDTEKALSVPAPIDKNRASLTLLNGPDAGQVYPLSGVDIIGRDFDAQVRIDDPSLSRTHARVVRQENGKYRLEDLGSTNGTFIGPDRVERRELVAGDRIQLGPKLILRFSITDIAEETLQRQLFESSTRDHLTRVYNRRYLMSRLGAEVAHARRHASALSLLLFDLDRFKDTNDRFGHLAGDAVLRGVGERVTALIRVEDVFARFGGEEFVVLIRATGPHDGERLAERLRASVEALAVRAEGVEIRTTISIGVASLSEVRDEGSSRDSLVPSSRPGEGSGPRSGGQELIALADSRLLRAKSEGRNRVVSSETPGAEVTAPPPSGGQL